MDALIQHILNAKVYDVARETPLEHAPKLSKRLSHTILLKREDLQSIFSFKIRGAYNKIAHLTDTEKRHGIIAASAGNHAQGVALAAQKLGISATIVMPKTTPTIKINSVQSFGATTILHGDSYDEALLHALDLAKAQHLTLIHPYDDMLVIAGQGTVAAEICRQHEGHIDALFIPVGGGGLIAGMSAYIKAIRPEIKIIGVEPDDAACMTAALDQKTRVKLDRIGLFADGAAVRQVGEENFRIASKTVDQMITVTSDEICAAIKDIFEDTRSISEPAGALAIAGLKKMAAQHPTLKHQTWIAINSGANISFDRLRYVSDRAEIGEYREALFAVTIPEKPGSFKTFCSRLGKRAITEFNYRYFSASEAHIFVGIELQKGLSEKQHLLDDLIDFPIQDLTDNELAKLHIRHMVGGHAPAIKNEHLFRFEFPERPGALLHFLTQLGENWNITLFHYRNQGAAYGRVLIGIDIPDTDSHQFQEFLENLGFPYNSENKNPAYPLFL